MSLREAEQARAHRAARTHAKQARKKKARGRSAGIGHNQGPPLDEPFAPLFDDQVLTKVEWCKLNRFSLRTGTNILAGGNGPRVLQLSARRIGIRVIDNRRWQESRAR
jgi:hypothetical protein